MQRLPDNQAAQLAAQGYLNAQTNRVGDDGKVEKTYNFADERRVLVAPAVAFRVKGDLSQYTDATIHQVSQGAVLVPDESGRPQSRHPLLALERDIVAAELFRLAANEANGGLIWDVGGTNRDVAPNKQTIRPVTQHADLRERADHPIKLEDAFAQMPGTPHAALNDGQVATLTFVHSAYYIDKYDIAAAVLLTQQRSAFVMVHRFDSKIGSWCENKSGTAEARYIVQDDSVTMVVSGGANFKHPVPFWLYTREDVKLDDVTYMVVDLLKQTHTTNLYKLAISPVPMNAGVDLALMADAGTLTLPALDLSWWRWALSWFTTHPGLVLRLYGDVVEVDGVFLDKKTLLELAANRLGLESDERGLHLHRRAVARYFQLHNESVGVVEAQYYGTVSFLLAAQQDQLGRSAVSLHAWKPQLDVEQLALSAAVIIAMAIIGRGRADARSAMLDLVERLSKKIDFGRFDTIVAIYSAPFRYGRDWPQFVHDVVQSLMPAPAPAPRVATVSFYSTLAAFALAEELFKRRFAHGTLMLTAWETICTYITGQDMLTRMCVNFLHVWWARLPLPLGVLLHTLHNVSAITLSQYVNVMQGRVNLRLLFGLFLSAMVLYRLWKRFGKPSKPKFDLRAAMCNVFWCDGEPNRNVVAAMERVRMRGPGNEDVPKHNGYPFLVRDPDVKFRDDSTEADVYGVCTGRLAVVTATGTNATDVAIMKRNCPLNPPLTDEMREELMVALKDCIVPRYQPTELQEWYARFPGTQRKNMADQCDMLTTTGAAAKASVRHKDGKARLHCRMVAFAKAEAVLKTEPTLHDPYGPQEEVVSRTIVGPPDSTKPLLGPMALGCSRVLGDFYTPDMNFVYGPACTPEQCAAFVLSYPEPTYSYFDVDFSKWDNSHRDGVLALVVEHLVQSCDYKSDIDVLGSLWEMYTRFKATTIDGTSVQADPMVLTGSVWTTCLNTFLNHVYHVMLEKELGFTVRHMCAGDDTVVIVQSGFAETFEKRAPEFYARWGLKSKLRRSTLCELRFCSQTLAPVAGYLPMRRLSKITGAVVWTSQCSLFYTFVPIFSRVLAKPWALRVVSRTMKDKIKVDMAQLRGTVLSSWPVMRVMPGMRAIGQAILDITESKEICKNNRKNIRSYEAAVERWRVSKLAWQDETYAQQEHGQAPGARIDAWLRDRYMVTLKEVLTSESNIAKRVTSLPIYYVDPVVQAYATLA